MRELKWKDLPKEIKETMLYYQEKQGNKRNKEVFKGMVNTILPLGGFNRSDTDEGFNFWEEVLYKGNIQHYYTKLPKMKDLVVHCETIEEAKAILLIAHKQGLMWYDGYSYLESDKYYVYNNKTAYNFLDSMFSNVTFYNNKRIATTKAKDILNGNLKTKEMKTRELKPKDAQRIIDIACSEWTDSLARLWGANIVTNQTLTIIENDYKEMRKACTTEQHELFDEIFGKDEEECPYEDGELIFVNFGDHEAWNLRYSTGKFRDMRVETYNNQKKHGSTSLWKQHAPAKGVELPK